MIKRSIKENFRICISGKSQWYPISIPGSAMDTFYREEILPDPYDRMNEYKWEEFFRNDFDIRGSFFISEEENRKEEIYLTFYGIDTVSDIFLNGNKLAHTENMHRIYTFPVKRLIHTGENFLEIHITSPVSFIEAYRPEKGREIHLCNTGTTPGAQYIRKSHSMFGWDWGPKLPDAGLFREIELCCFDKGKIGNVLIRQRHDTDKVVLHVQTEIDKAGNKEEKFLCIYELYTPEGENLYRGSMCDIEITEPRLWWPNGYGEQPLYQLKVILTDGKDILDEKKYRIGLRTITVSREEDQWGQEFAVKVNGVKIFARGADYIPDDCFYPRITEQILKRDIEACVFANYNCLRVWGGGYYPSDEFYDLCDEYGILLWQDFMYACNIYDLTPDFVENIKEEAKDNLLRFRNHACLALLCGNNEMETAWTDWKDAQGHAPSLKRDYLIQFEYIFPQIVSKIAPDTFYWPSSPSSGGSFDEPGDENRGDCHYWDVWHGQKPFSEYTKHYFRFCSEFGFQSLPSIKTIETFTREKDRNLFSQVMESHQKNPAANGKILYYLSETFRYPKNLESLIFLSQILQGYAMKTASEHWRRNRGRCMGSIYWQFNDNWPVASWSSMDYYGRYKALHYMAKNFYDSVAGSIEKNSGKISFWISNETGEDIKVKGTVSLKTMNFAVIWEQHIFGEVSELCSQKIFEKDFSDTIKGRENSVFLVVDYEYEKNGKNICKKEFEVFVPVKYLELEEPEFESEIKTDGTVEISAKSFVPYCMLEGKKQDTVWEENVAAFTDTGKYVFHPVQGTEIPRDGIQIYDVYHTCHEEKNQEVYYQKGKR